MMFRFQVSKSQEHYHVSRETGVAGRGGCGYLKATQSPMFSVTLSLRGGYQVQKGLCYVC